LIIILSANLYACSKSCDAPVVTISPLNALAKRVLPFPGGPSNIKPFGVLTLNFLYFS